MNKVVAASTRTKARDYVDLVTIAQRMCPLGPLVMAAAGKPPHFSPQKILDEIGRRGLSVPSDGYETVKGLPADWNAATIRDLIVTALDAVENYVLRAPAEIVGLLAVDHSETPIEVRSSEDEQIVPRRATSEPEVMPYVTDAAHEWKTGP